MHLSEELLPGGDGPGGDWLTIQTGENTTLKEKERHNRQEGRAFRHTSSNGVIA